MTTPTDSRRIIIIGGPRAGKSTLARKLRQEEGFPTFCGDPLSKVKDPEDGVTYLPEGLSWSEGSEFIARNWLTMEGPWICEGVSLVRALRKALDLGLSIDGIEVTYLKEPKSERTPGQIRMAHAVETIWREVEARMKDEGRTKSVDGPALKEKTTAASRSALASRPISIRAL